MIPSDETQQLREQYTEIARLAGGLAHEIKNPLSTIRLNMELLAEEFNDPESPRDRRAQARIAMVQRECERLQGLLDDYLRYTRVRQTALEPSDLNEEVMRAIDFFRPKAAVSNIEIFPYLQDGLPSVLLDRESFQGALLNLILNAQQAMPDGGQLVVGTEATPRGVALHLIDTGVGMDTKSMGKIFDAFYSTKPGGSGLGLPTTRRIIEAHGGTIFVQSEPGRGTRFTIELPTPARLAGQPELP
ncbi:MAG TPA: ATP-binding protein [Pirellulales bacterium]|jgi:signal transduction histidine kinase|nr:ATP-binding protein [Pirellulales bacterium]